MKINADLIKSLKPYQDELERYLNYYEHQEFTLEQFCELGELTKQDKIWYLCQMLTEDQEVVFCMDAALRTLSTDFYESVMDSTYTYAYCYAYRPPFPDWATEKLSAAFDHGYLFAAYYAYEGALAAAAFSDESLEVLLYILKGKK